MGVGIETEAMWEEQKAVITSPPALAGPGGGWPLDGSDWSQVVHCWAQRTLLNPADTQSRAIKHCHGWFIYYPDP